MIFSSIIIIFFFKFNNNNNNNNNNNKTHVPWVYHPFPDPSNLILAPRP